MPGFVSSDVKAARRERKARCSERIRAAWVESGLSQDKLARLAGVSRQTFTEWVAGRSIPRYDKTWRALAAALGKDELWLRGYSDKIRKELKANAAAKKAAPLFECAEKRIAPQSPSSDGLPTDTTSICFHATRDIYDRIREMALADGITLRAELTRCMKAYFESLDSPPPSESGGGGSVVAIALGENALHDLDAECALTGESRSEAAARLLSMVLDALSPYLRQRKGAEENAQ